MTPTKNLITVVTSMLKEAWDQRLSQTDQANTAVKRQLVQLGAQQDAMLDRLVETTNPKVIAAYEAKIAKLDEDKLLLTDQLSKATTPKHSMEDIFELLRDFLSNPWNIYKNGDLNLKKTVLRTTFAAPWRMTGKAGFELRNHL